MKFGFETSNWNKSASFQPSHNENSTPLKQSLFGQSSQNQNTPANNLGSGNSVRRSSRLFTSSQQPSIKAKENTKTPGQNVSPKGVKSFKSPSKKSGKSSRQQPQSRHPSNPGANSEVTEMNEKNKLMDVDGGKDGCGILGSWNRNSIFEILHVVNVFL